MLYGFSTGALAKGDFRAALAMLLQMLQKEPDHVRRDVNDGEFVNLFLYM